MRVKILTGKHKNRIAKIIKIDKHEITPIKVSLDGVMLRFHPGELQMLRRNYNDSI